ncbi:MAG: GLUG motif-containing protein [Steroidobacteraceae bacterium]
MNRHTSMNRIYSLVWSQVSNVRWHVAETAKGRRKPGRAISVASRSACAAAISLALGSVTHATPAAPPCVAAACATAVAASSHPTGGRVVSGTGSITQSGNTTDIRQSSPDISIDWLSFNVGSQETVDFLQPFASAIAVNQILSPNGSQILGHLNANGQVWLVNPNGVLFGQGALVNVGGLVASTLDLGDANSSGNARIFSGDGTGNVINEGTITAADGGYIALLGNQVSNQGTITARFGTVALGAGSAATLTFEGDSLIKMQVDQNTLNNLAENGGLIQADGGRVIMSAGAQNALLASVVNNTGVIEARTVENHDGTISLLGGMTAGTVNVGGTLDASAPEGGNGGFIETSAAHVEVANDVRVTTLAAATGKTGTWLIDPTDFTVAPSGGDITGATLSSGLNSTNFTILSSDGASPVTGGGSGGNININDTVSWSANTTLTLTAANNVNVNSSMTASGATAAFVIQPNTANGTEAASGSGTLNLGAGASITLSGANAGLSIATPNISMGAGAVVNLPNVAPSSTTALIVGGTPYTVINSLGSAGSTTGTDLQGINGNLSGHYALGSNILASATGMWNSGAGFTPIGNPTAPFTGSFNGLGHIITFLYIYLPSADDVGLFGYTGSGSVIQNVGLAGVAVYGTTLVGGLVGYNNGTVSNGFANGEGVGNTGSVSGASSVGGLIGASNGSVSNSYALDSVIGTSESTFVGGLVGYNVGPISNSYATGSVSGFDYVGGLVGANLSTVGNSYATGIVNGATGSTFVGGLVGYNVGQINSGATISNSYATGRVIGSGEVGGLVGLNDSGATISNSYATGSAIGTSGSSVGGMVGVNSGSISNSYATGSVSVSGGGYVGGLVAANGGTVSNSFWDTTTSGQSTSAGGTGLTTAQMQMALNFTGFTFTTTPGASGNNWVIVDGDGTLNNAGGAAGVTFPMLASEYSTTINNAHQLQLMTMNLAAGYSLGQAVNALGTSNNSDVWSSTGFVPIGNSTTPFTGSFNGLGYLIASLTINLPSANYVGLFGDAGAASVIKNVGIGYAGISGYEYVGGLVGYNSGSIFNSYATYGTTGGSFDVGGLVGSNYGTINNSYATGSVSGNGGENVGGLVGYNSGGAISNSYATGSVSGANSSGFVGGLVGYNSGPITNSYATSTVSGGVDVGGLVGDNLGTISSGYATGSVSGVNTANDSSSIGGLVGYNSGPISNSYATGSVSGNSSVGGLVGGNSGTVGDSYATGSVSGASNSFYVGGLVGYNYNGATVIASYATGSVSGTDYTGGLVGANSSGDSISNSYATGSVSGTSSVGGLIGYSYGTVSSSYATGAVSGSLDVGGLAGYNYSGATVIDSYATGRVKGTTAAGGLVGANSGKVSSSFWDTTTSGLSISAGGTGLTTAQMQTTSSFTGFTFTTTPGASGNDWVIVDEDGTLNNAGGAAGATFPMLASEYSTTIVNTHQLQLMAMNLGASYSLGQVINASATGSSSDVWSSAGFAPIGNSTSPFTGSLNGLEYYIESLTIDLPSANNVGLFGYTGSGSVIQNVRLAGQTVSGAGAVGGLVGSNSGAISSSYAEGNVSGTGSDVGGLVGINSGSISNSYGTGHISGASYVGGLVGYDSSGTSISNSYAEGWMSGASYVGGLVGYNSSGASISNSYALVYASTQLVSGSSDVGGLVGDNLGTVSSSYAEANVSGTANVGGLVGANAGIISSSYAYIPNSVSSASYVGGLVGYNSGSISNSYLPGGSVSGSGGEYVGGLVGYNSNSGSISNSYAMDNVNGSGGEYVGGLVGYNGGSIGNGYATGSVSGGSGIGGLVGGNVGTVTNSVWDITTSEQTVSAAGTGLTTAQMQTASSFTGWSIATTGGSGDVWRIYQGDTFPLLLNFLTPLTLANATVIYNGIAQSGATTTANDIFGAAASGTNVGAYSTGYYSNQEGYDISGGNLTINQLASVAWVGGATGNWSTASNWAGGAIPDLLTDSGKLVMAAGNLSTTGNLSTSGYTQTGGTLEVGGTLTINAKSGGVKLGNIDAAALSVTAAKGTITQLAGTTVDVTGATSLTADNGTAGLDTITLAQAGDTFGGTVTAGGSAITLRDKTALTVVLDSSGVTTLTAAGDLNVSGTVGTTLTTKTTGAKHTTTFGATTVGTSLVVTSAGTVTETSSNILTVAGEGTTTVSNPNVTVNGVNGAEIPAP